MRACAQRCIKSAHAYFSYKSHLADIASVCYTIYRFIEIIRQSMTYRKYAVFGFYGLLGFLVIYSSNCNASLLPQQVTQIAQQIFNPFCFVKSYGIELEEPGYPYIPFYGSPASIVASGTVTGASGASLSLPFSGAV